MRALYRLVGRRLSIAFGVVTGLVVASAVALAYDQARFGGRGGVPHDPQHRRRRERRRERLDGGEVVQTVLTLASIALLPLLTAIVVDSMAKARLAITTGILTGPLADHVVVVGLGDVGPG